MIGSCTQNRRWTTFVVALAALVFASAVPTLAKKKGSSSTDPGEYKNWAGKIDVLEIVKKFQRSDFDKIVLSGFDTTGTELPEADDNTYEPVKEVLAEVETPFLQGLRGEIATTVTTGEAESGALVISGVVEEMDPGSRSARYWAGFGAGAARTVVRIEIKDGGSGETLLKIKQERRSGVGGSGGGYVNLMNRNLRAIGRDVALVLGAF